VVAYKNESGFNTANLLDYKTVSAQLIKINGRNYYLGQAPYPVTPSVGDIWEELNVGGYYIERWFWNGTYWLSANEYSEFVTQFITNGNAIRMTCTKDITSNLFLLRVYALANVGSNNNATNYWTLQLSRVNFGQSQTLIGSALSTQNLPASQYLPLTQNLNLHINVAATSFASFISTIARIGTAGNFSATHIIFYRKARI
jgi:hypothetical protein